MNPKKQMLVVVLIALGVFLLFTTIDIISTTIIPTASASQLKVPSALSFYPQLPIKNENNFTNEAIKYGR